MSQNFDEVNSISTAAPKGASERANQVPAASAKSAGSGSLSFDTLDATLEKYLRNHRFYDSIFFSITKGSALLVLGILIAILVTLIYGSLPSLRFFGWRFLSSADWDPVAEKFGALVPIYGTLVTSAIALVIAVPVSLGIAFFLTEIAPNVVRTPVRIAVELLAAIPSIIYGMWGLFIFAPFFALHVEPFLIDYFGAIPIVGFLFQGPAMGIGVLTAGIILAVMIIPFISSVMCDVFELVPFMLKESAYGLGSTTWEVVWKVVVSHSRVGIMGGVMLGLGRALGETMAVTFVIGNAHDLQRSLLMPGNTISSALANEFTEAVGPMYTSSLIELGLVLFLITFIVLAIAKLMLMKMAQKDGTAT